MNASREIARLDPTYPSRLRTFDESPPSITVRGGALEAEQTVAVVGSRRATPRALHFATELSRALVRAGAVVVSGGAVGIDAAAHRAALASGGTTWAIAGTGPDRCYPPEHDALFDAIGGGPGAVLWPFGPGKPPRSSFLTRNRVLVALADAVVVVQAGWPSGALHAAGWARKLKKPLWVVPAAPWAKRFAGSLRLLEDGATPLTSVERLLSTLNSAPASNPAKKSVTSLLGPEPAFSTITLSPNETKALAAMSNVSLHIDAIGVRSNQTAQAVTAALLTLVLENVVVEGPPGFFRRRDSG